MTDSVNKDAKNALFFDFYIDTPVIHETGTETMMVAVSGRTWEVSTAETIKTNKPQLFFAAKSGRLFNRVSA